MKTPRRVRLPNPWQLSLRQKLSFWSFVPTVSILIVALLAYGGYQQATADLAIERNRDVTRLVAEQLAAEIEESVHVLDVLTRDPAMQSGQLGRQIQCLEQAKGRLTPFDAGIMILSAEGRVVAGLPSPSSWQGRDMSRATWYDSRLPRFSNIVLESPAGEQGIILTVPIYNAQDECIGVLAGLFNIPPSTAGTLYGGLRRGMGLRGVPAEDILYVDDKGQLHPAVEVSALARLFQHTRDVGTDRAGDRYYIIDSLGRALYHPDRWMIGEDMSEGTIVGQALKGHIGAARIRNSQGELVVASYAPIKGTPWMLVSEEPWDTLMAYSLESRNLILLLLAIGVLLPAIVVTLAVRRITDPLRQMIGAAKAVASGQFGHTIQANTGDEMEDLAQQFNTMSTQLEASYSELEQRVADRTRELETLTTVAVQTSQLLDLEDVLQIALEQTLTALHLDAGEAFCADPESDASHVLTTIGFENPSLANTDRGPICDTRGLSIRIRRSDIGMINITKSLREVLETEGIQQLIRVPIIAKTECIGALNLAAKHPQVYDPEALSMLSSIGHHVGVAAENVQLHTKAQQLAIVEERNRLARELHDSVTQSLYAITFYAEAAARLISRGQSNLATSHLSDVGHTAQAALQEMRLLVYDLRPPILEEEGLVGALQARLDAVEGRAGVQARLVVNGAPRRTPHDQTLYRVTQEALNNAVRHAEASRIDVAVSYDESTLSVDITDDGIGFEPTQPVPEGHLGLLMMRERAHEMGAVLQISSRPGIGTRICVEVPYER